MSKTINTNMTLLLIETSEESSYGELIFKEAGKDKRLCIFSNEEEWDNFNRMFGSNYDIKQISQLTYTMTMNNKLTAQDFYNGGVEEKGIYVTISWEHNCYHIKRHPSHPAGWTVSTKATLKEARSEAYKLAFENPLFQMPIDNLTSLAQCAAAQVSRLMDFAESDLTETPLRVYSNQRGIRWVFSDLSQFWKSYTNSKHRKIYDRFGKLIEEQV